MTLPLIDLAVIGIYLMVILLIGIESLRRSRTSNQFMAADRSMPGWAVGLSILGTFLSSNTFLGVPGKVFAGDWNVWVFSLTLLPAAWIATRFFVPFYRRGEVYSAYEHLEKRFGRWARTYAVVCYLATQVARCGTILYGVSLAMSPLTGVSTATLVLIAGIVVTVYTVLGGIEAVIWTDVIQSIVLATGALVVLGMLWLGITADQTSVVQAAWDQGKMSLGSWSLDPTQPTVWVLLAYGLAINLTNFGIDQSYVQRYIVARDDAGARRSVWIGALLYIPISLAFCLIGTGLWIEDASRPARFAELRWQAAAELEGRAQELGREEIPSATEINTAIADKVFPEYLAHSLPVGIAGLVVAAIIAAAMSSVDTSINSSATVILQDLYGRYVHPNPSEGRKMTVLHGATLLMGTAGTCAALAMIGRKGLLDMWWMWSGILAGGMLGLFLLGMIAKRTGGFAAAVAVALGTGVIAWASQREAAWIPPEFRNHLDANLTIVVGTLTIFFVGWGIGALIPRRERQSES